MNKENPKFYAILVMDILNDFCSNKGLLKKKGMNISRIQKIVPKIIRFVEDARKIGFKIIFIKSTYDKKYLKPNVYKRYKKLGLEKLCQERSWGSDFYRIKPEKEDKVFVKHTMDPFTNPKLEKWLKKNKIKNLVLTGWATDACVDSAARTGFYKGFNIVAIKDCLASLGNKKRDLEFYKRFYDARIFDSKSFLKLFRN